MAEHPNWHELHERGFTVVKGLLSEERLEEVRTAMQRDANLPPPVDFSLDVGARSLASSAAVPGPIAALLIPAVEAVFGELRAGTPLEIDKTYPAPRWFRPGVATLHTDTNPYWMFQDFSHYVNFWIPLIKTDAETTGLAVIPRDVLEREEPELYAATLNRGALMPYPRSLVEQGLDAIRAAGEVGLEAARAAPGARTAFLTQDPDSGRVLCILPNNDPETYLVSPHIEAGDALVLRGDVIHATQDTEQLDRLAVSIRAFHSGSKVTLDFLTRLPPGAKRHLCNPDGPEFPFLIAYHALGPELTAGQLCDFVMASQEPGTEAHRHVQSMRGRGREFLMSASQAPPRG